MRYGCERAFKHESKPEHDCDYSDPSSYDDFKAMLSSKVFSRVCRLDPLGHACPGHM